MKNTRAAEHRFAALTRFGLICCLVIALTCAGPSGIAFATRPRKTQEDDNEIDTIGVNNDASGPLLDLLANDFSIVKINAPTAPFNLVPVIIGPAVLNNQQIMAYVISVYNAGLTVAIVNATQDQANRFEALVEGEQVASCNPASGESQIALYGLQQAIRELPGELARYCLPDLSDAHRKAKKAEEKWLDERFRPTPAPSPQQSVPIINDDSVNLDSLSQKIHCSWFESFRGEGQIQQDTFLTSIRSFDSQRDYYYVQDYAQFLPLLEGSPIYNHFPMRFSASFSHPSLPANSTGVGARVTFTEPDTTVAYVSSYTNSQSFTFGGSAGFSARQGPNISASGSYTIGTSTTTTVPPIEILNRTNPGIATPLWEFTTQYHPQRKVLYSFPMSFLWYIDRSPDYGDNVTELSTTISATMQQAIADPSIQSYGASCEFPPPFPTFDVGSPVITDVEPTSAQRGGGSFLIHGSQMYPGIVSSVLLGGDPLNPENFAPINDREIRVVVPSSQQKGETPVQVNTSFSGNTLFSNNNVMINIK